MPADLRRQALPHTQPVTQQSSAPTCPKSNPRIVVLNSSRLIGEMLRTTLRGAFVSATIVAASSIGEVDDALNERPVDLLVTDISAGDGDPFDQISSWDVANGSAKRTLVVTAHREAAVVHTLMRLPVGGVFDTAADGMEKLDHACAQVISGGTYWSVSMQDALVEAHLPSRAIFRKLTPTEQMVLGVIGDGCDDETAADKLPLTVKSIRSVRQALHEKFGVQHKGQLMERAAHFGFVIRMTHGTVRPGLNTLIAAHRKPTLRPQEPALRSVA